jgi:hypothetical protein
MCTKPLASFVPHSSPDADPHAMATHQPNGLFMYFLQWHKLIRTHICRSYVDSTDQSSGAAADRRRSENVPPSVGYSKRDSDVNYAYARRQALSIFPLSQSEYANAARPSK